MELVVFTFAYLISYFCAAYGYYILSGVLTLISAAGLAIFEYKRYGRLNSPAVLFSMAWIGGAGVSALKLSYLQTNWRVESWLCFYLTYVCFMLAYKAGTRYISLKGREENAFSADGGANARNVELMMDVIAVISVVCLLVEGKIMGYIPVFLVDTPHAYSYFHVSGVHYFTISCVMLPALAVLYCHYLLKEKVLRTSPLHLINVAVCASLGIIIPILLVSRYQMLFGILLAASTFVVIRGGQLRIPLNKYTLITGALGFAAVLAMYVFITIQRDHSIEYLNGIFEMKYGRMPIFISQPYIYIANNFDNFNCLVEQLPEHTHGLRMLFPVIALSGLKFLKPELAAFPIFVTKEELTTVTLIYDSYYDFGMIGVIVFAAVLGLAAALLEKFASKGPAQALIFAQFCIYLALSFFTTWFSNPTTWFLFGLTVLMGLYLYIKNKFQVDIGGNRHG